MILIERKRKTYLDFLRIMSAFFVIYHHSPGFRYYTEANVSPAEKFFAIFGATSVTIHVPLFFMVSGALLLNKEENYRTLFVKRILRFFIVLFCSSFVTFVLSTLTLNPGTFFIDFFTGSVEPAFWFLYAYLGFLFILPFLRKIAKHLSKADIFLVLTLRFVFSSLLPILNYCAKTLGLPLLYPSSHFTVPFALDDILFYPLIGFYFDHYYCLKRNKKNMLIILFILILTGNCLSTIITYHQGAHSVFSQSYLTLFNYSSALATFLCIKYFFEHSKSNKAHSIFCRLLHNIAPLTLGIYVMEPVSRSVFYKMVCMFLGFSVHPIVSSLAYCCVSMTICGSITYVLKKLPYIKKLL